MPIRRTFFFIRLVPQMIVVGLEGMAMVSVVK
jgi:hypothetical protein